MKKFFLGIIVILCLFVMTGCKEKRDIDFLMSSYAKAYTKADLETAKDIFPKFYLKYQEKNVNQESLDKELKAAKERYGDDFNITYKVEKEIKLTDEELKTLNEKLKKNYKTEDEAEECYKYEGTITLKGSKKADELSLDTIGRCKYDGVWYLVRR